MRVAINSCWGGFSLSEEAVEMLGLEYRHSEIDRADPKLIACIEKLGEAANGKHAELKIMEIPDGIEYEIYDHDGMESIHEKHKSWY